MGWGERFRPRERLSSSIVADRSERGIPLPEADLQSLVDRWAAAEREVETVNTLWAETYAAAEYPPSEVRADLTRRQKAANDEHRQAVAALLRAAR